MDIETSLFISIAAAIGVSAAVLLARKKSNKVHNFNTRTANRTKYPETANPNIIYNTIQNDRIGNKTNVSLRAEKVPSRKHRTLPINQKTKTNRHTKTLTSRKIPTSRSSKTRSSTQRISTPRVSTPR